MATQVQLRRGTTAQNDAFTGVEGELTFDTQTHRLRTHDGITLGGFEIALLSDLVSPPFLDTNPLIRGSLDSTKRIRFEVDGLTAGAVRILTPPDADINIAATNISNAWADGVKQTFNPNATSAGINVGAHTADPAPLVDGDIWYNSTTNLLRARVNGTSTAFAGLDLINTFTVNQIFNQDISVTGVATIGDYLLGSTWRIEDGPAVDGGYVLTRADGAGANVWIKFGGSTNSFPGLKRDTTTLKLRLADDSADADFSANDIELSGNLLLTAGNMQLNGVAATISFANGTIAEDGAGITLTGDITHAGITFLNGNTTVAGLLQPDVSDSRDLGASGQKWRDFYLGRDSIGSTITASAYLSNNTAAAAGAQQYSPAIKLTGQGWKTNAVAASQPVDYRIYCQPVQGTANPSARFIVDVSINGGAPINMLVLDSTGAASSIAGSINISSLTASGNVTILSTGEYRFGLAGSGRSILASSADGLVELFNTAKTGFTRLNFGGTTSSFPAIRRTTTALNIRLADDSADAGLTALSITTSQTTFMHRTSAALADGAAAAAGTLLNAPAAGDPTKWIPIDDNGTTRYIPAW